MAKKLIITAYDNRIISMLTEDGKDLRIEFYSPEEDSILDNIYVARVRDLVNNIGAAFVEIAPQETCYFSVKENPDPIFLNVKKNDRLCQGDLLLVQIKRVGMGTKAPVASCRLSLTGKYLALTMEQPDKVGVSRKIKDESRIDELKTLVMPYVNDKYGFIVRTDSADAGNNLIMAELYELQKEFEELLRLAVSRPAFTLMKKAVSPVHRDILSYRLTADDEIITDIPEMCEELSAYHSKTKVRFYNDKILPLSKLYSVEHRLEAALNARVWLKSGGYIIIEPTEALTTIDVNTGKFDGVGKDREKTFLKINLEACDEIARQLILRNISGIIIIDFINLKDTSDRKQVEERMKERLNEDPVKAVFVEFTKLDLMEITRKKIKQPLYEAVKNNKRGGGCND